MSTRGIKIEGEKRAAGRGRARDGRKGKQAVLSLSNRRKGSQLRHMIIPLHLCGITDSRGLQNPSPH